MTITPALENYLKIILELNESKGEARVTSLSERFGVTKATVSQTVEKLMKYGLAKKMSMVRSCSLIPERQRQSKFETVIWSLKAF